MATGDSPTSICNTALALLSEDPIADIDPPDGSKRGRLCRQFYDPCRRAMLGSLAWQCATKQATLPERTVPPDFEYAHGYTLPVDFLTVFEVEPDDMAWEVMHLDDGGICIASDAPPPLKLTYIADVQDPRLWPPLLVAALSADIAASMAYPLARDSALKQACMADRDAALKQAALVNATQASFRNLQVDATTPEGVGRMALAMLGGDQSVDPPENNRRARLARQFFPIARRTILQSGNWRCARKNAQLSAIPGLALPEWGTAYQMPADFVRFYDVGRDAPWLRWEIITIEGQGLCLLSDGGGGQTLWVTYIYDLEDPALMDPLMVQAIAAEIAAALALPLLKDGKVKQQMEMARDRYLSDARTASAQQASPVVFDADVLLRARW